jgi:hypothetical protein
MKRVVFLLEEYSAKVLLEALLPRIFPALPFLCVSHEGKQDLEKSIPRKLRAWHEPGVRFVVIRDNDRGDCVALKARLVELCATAGRPDALIRIACQELEAWYFGEPEALAEAFDQESLREIGQTKRYRDADGIVQPSTHLKALIPEFQKMSGARRLGTRLSPDRNRSRSFQALMAGLRRLADDMTM